MSDNNLQETERLHVVIIGGSFGGLKCDQGTQGRTGQGNRLITDDNPFPLVQCNVDLAPFANQELDSKAIQG